MANGSFCCDSLTRKNVFLVCLTTTYPTPTGVFLALPRAGELSSEARLRGLRAGAQRLRGGANGFYGQTPPPYVTLGAQTAKEPMRE